MSFSTEVLAVIALILDEEEEEKRRRHWVRPKCMLRGAEGEFVKLYKGLVDDESKFYQYFRMSQRAFNDLLIKIEMFIIKKDTFWRSAISARERLAVCLR
jgi:hypothetical protein